MIVPMFNVGPWTCDYQPRKGHVFSDGAGGRILVREVGRRMTVQRTWRARYLNEHPPTYGNVHDGGEQGGGDINLRFRYDQARLDGTIERHAIGWWEPDGTPHMPGTRYPLQQFEPTSPYAKIDGAHYLRAFEYAGASLEPVANFWRKTCSADVRRRFSYEPFSDAEGPEYSLGTMWVNVQGAARGSGALGICRELAHALRAVVESQRGLTTFEEFEWIRRMLTTIELGQAENGAVEAHTYGCGVAQEEAEARAFGIPEGTYWCVSWQVPYLIRAVYEAMRVEPGFRELGRRIIARFKPWYVRWPGTLPRYLIMGRNGQPVKTITEGVGPGIPTWDADARYIIAELGL